MRRGRARSRLVFVTLENEILSAVALLLLVFCTIACAMDDDGIY